MRRIDYLVTLARERSKNLDYTEALGVASQGLSTNQFLEWANSAQDHLQAAILASYPDEFVDTEDFTTTANDGDYTLTDRVFVNNKIILVEYASSGREADLEPLDQIAYRHRRVERGTVTGYMRRGNTIYLSALPPGGGLLRVHFYRELDDIDIRRAKVNGTPSGTSITLLGPTGAAISSDELSILNSAEYVCICNSVGEPLLYNGLVVSAIGTTLTLAANVSTYLVSGGTLAGLANGYITTRAWSTTHSKLPDNCERYLTTYMQKRAMTTDESETSVEEDVELKTIEGDIVMSFAESSRDIKYIPVVDDEIMI